MRKLSTHNPLKPSAILGAAGLATLLLAGSASAQIITNAFDTAANGNFNTGGNGGYGFGAWSLNTPGGGSYVSGGFFGLWNNSFGAGTGSFATRAFASNLSVGQTFTATFKNGHLNSSLEQAGFNLEDASGNVLFSYWQQGGNNANGSYLDAGGAGTATGFAYDYDTVESYAFTLTGTTSYTFADLAHPGVSFNGTISGTIDKLQMFRQSLAGDPLTGGGGGTDFRFTTLQVTTAVPEPSLIALAGLSGMGGLFLARRRLPKR